MNAPRNLFGGLIGLLLLGLSGLWGQIKCRLGIHKERQFGREDSYEQNWHTGLCERCGERIR